MSKNETELVTAAVLAHPVPATRETLIATGDQVIARPIVTPAMAAQVVREWEELKKAIGLESDIRREKRWTKNGEVEIAYYKKSYWRKAATFLGLSIDAAEGSEKFEVVGGVKLASVVYTCTGPNGRHVPGDGHCGSDEPGKAGWTLANLKATAHSRAYNRAVSNYIGGGEVSADEMDGEETAEVEKAVDQAPKAAEVMAQLRAGLAAAKSKADCAELWKGLVALKWLPEDVSKKLKDEISQRASEFGGQ